MGNRIARLEARGICTHGHVQGPVGHTRAGDNAGPIKCLKCGEVFRTQRDWQNARDEALA